MRTRIAAALLVFAAVAVGSGVVLPAGAADTVVVVNGEGLSPARIDVVPGDLVTFVNDDKERHRFRSSDGEGFDTGDIEPGEASTVAFRQAGTFGFEDVRTEADRYKGTVVVGAPAPSGGEQGGPVRNPTVTIADNAFSPSTITVSQGASISWTNRDDRDHTVTARGGSFDSGTLSPAGQFSHVFGATGEFPYFCEIHADMTGTVNVTAPSGAATTATTASPAAPGSSAGSAPDGEAGTDGEVEVVDYDFEPNTLTIGRGAAVTWRFTGRGPHTVTADDASFDSGRREQGATFTRAFAEPGTYEYKCEIHPSMTGTIEVSSEAGIAAEGSHEEGFPWERIAGYSLIGLPVAFMILAPFVWGRGRPAGPSAGI